MPSPTGAREIAANLSQDSLFYTWDCPGKNPGVGCHFLLQGIFPTQGSNPSPALAGGFFTAEPPGKPLDLNKLTSEQQAGQDAWKLVPAMSTTSSFLDFRKYFTPLSPRPSTICHK